MTLLAGSNQTALSLHGQLLLPSRHWNQKPSRCGLVQKLGFPILWASFPKSKNKSLNLTIASPRVPQRGFSHFQPHQVIKAILGHRGGEESREDTDPLDFTEESLVEKGSQGFRDPQALQARQGWEGSLVSRDFQVTRWVATILGGKK